VIRQSFLALIAFAASGAATPPPVDTVSRAEALKLLGASGDDLRTTRAVWNREPTVFVDWLYGPDDETERLLFAVQKSGGHLRPVKVTVAEQEGGSAAVAAIAFANADRDAEKELVVILTWPVAHHDVHGTLYEVRLFDDLHPSQTALAPLPKLSRHFGSECDCDWTDGSSKRFGFKTIAAVRRELSRMGY
jgi:hypothetical protein